jgi:hypothetical protein
MRRRLRKARDDSSLPSMLLKEPSMKIKQGFPTLSTPQIGKIVVTNITSNFLSQCKEIFVTSNLFQI